MPQVKLGAGVGVGEGVVVVEVDLLFSAEGGQALAVNSVGAGGNEMRAGERVVVERLTETADVESRVVRNDGCSGDERLKFRPEPIERRGRFGFRGRQAVNAGERFPVKVSRRLNQKREALG